MEKPLISNRNKVVVGLASLSLLVGGFVVDVSLKSLSKDVNSITHGISGVGSAINNGLKNLPGHISQPPHITAQTITDSISYKTEDLIVGGQISSFVAVNADVSTDTLKTEYNKVYPITVEVGSQQGVNYLISEDTQTTTTQYSNGITKQANKIIAVNAKLNQPSTQSVAIDYLSPANYAPITAGMPYSQIETAIHNYEQQLALAKAGNAKMPTVNVPIKTAPTWIDFIAPIGAAVNQFVSSNQTKIDFELANMSSTAAYIAGEVQTYSPTNKNYQAIIANTNQQVIDELTGQFPGAVINTQTASIASEFNQMLTTINQNLKQQLQNTPFNFKFNYDTKTRQGAFVLSLNNLAGSRAVITVLLGTAFNNPQIINSLNAQLNQANSSSATKN